MKYKPSIQTKAALGYVLLVVLLIASIGYIFTEMRQLTRSDHDQDVLARQRKLTAQVMNRLHQAEVLGQSLSAGSLEQYSKYRRLMRETSTAIDSLQILLTDNTQLMRLDTVRMLIVEKERNMRNLLDAIREGGTEKLYQQHLKELEAEQDTLINHQQQHISHKTITISDSYAMPKKPKKFFKRLAEVFVPDKKDSIEVTNVIHEQYIDTIDKAYNPVDTVASLLNDISARVADSQRTSTADINRRTRLLRVNGLKLNQKVNQLLTDIENREQKLSNMRREEGDKIKRHSALTLTAIAIAAILLAGIFFLLVWRDVARSNHYRRELEKAKKKAEDLLKTRENLMLTITHDIKAPTGSILGYIDLLSRITHEERQRFYLDNMHGSASHLLNLVNALLDYHRLDADKMSIDRTTFSPAELFLSIDRSFDPLANNKGLQLVFKPDLSLDTISIGDPFRIRQIVENLLSNAIKFTAKGEVTLHAGINKGRLSFSVSDTGIGIPPEERNLLFKEFSRLKNAQAHEGFGLGLAITHKLVQLLDGTIGVASTPGKGTTFAVEMPLPAATPGIEKAFRNRSKQTLPVCEKRVSLLLIDDDRIQLELTRNMLSMYPIDCTCCLHPNEALQRIQKEHYDAVLTDLQMPAMNGFELISAIRKLPIEGLERLPVIAVTARSDMRLEQIKAQGFDDLLHKPFTAQEAAHIIGRLLSCTLPTAKEQVSMKPEKEEDESRFSFESLTMFSEGDNAAAAEIINIFIAETAKNSEALSAALAQKEPSTLAALAHKMLPVCSMIGATRTAELLHQLETMNIEQTAEAEYTWRTQEVLTQLDEVMKAAQSYVATLA